MFNYLNFPFQKVSVSSNYVDLKQKAFDHLLELELQT
jgi:hypothetical protein